MQSRTFTIGAVIVVLLAFIGLAAFIITKNRASLDPQEVTQRFYEEWVDTTRNAPPTGYDRELHRRSTYVTDQFSRSVDVAYERGLDPVLCLGSAPTQFELRPAAINSEGTGAAVRFNADNARGRAILITDEKGWWRIDEVDCDVDISKTLVGTTTSSTSAATSSATSSN